MDNLSFRLLYAVRITRCARSCPLDQILPWRDTIEFATVSSHEQEVPNPGG
jgi:hypothetical protein